MSPGTLSLFCSVIAQLSIASYPVQAKEQTCAAFYFSDSDFSSVERDHLPSLLYVWSGPHKEEHGVAFLIDPTSNYYLTARHVVAATIADRTQPIVGLDSSQHPVRLELKGENESLDVALLASSGSGATGGMAPYELLLMNPAPENVTFSGMAFANSDHVAATQPKEDRFVLSDDGAEIQLRVNTDFGDSGAPVYTRQGLVIGMVTGKQKLSQAIVLPLRSISDFITPFSMNLPRGSGAWKLHDDIMNQHNPAELAVELTPAHLPGRPSNFEFLGAIELILHNDELGRIDPATISCPLVEAAHDRGLRDAAIALIKADVPYEIQRKENKTTPGAAPTPPSSSQSSSRHAEAEGDVLQGHADDWLPKDKPFSKRLAGEAEAKYGEAIVATLKEDEALTRAFAVDTASSQSRRSSDVALFSATRLSRFGHLELTSARAKDHQFVKDDHFAELLQKYFHAAVYAGDDAIGTFGFETIAAWANLVSASPPVRASSLLILGDALQQRGNFDKALRSFAEAYRLQPTKREYLDRYTMLLQSRGTDGAGRSVATEAALSPREILPVGAVSNDSADLPDIKIGVAVPQAGNPYYLAMQMGVQRAAEELNAVGGVHGQKVVLIEPEAVKNVVSSGADQVRQLIAKNVDAIILQPGNEALSRASGELAFAAKVPVIYVNQRPDSYVPSVSGVATVGFDEKVSGRLEGQELAKCLGGKGRIAILEGQPASAIAVDRTKEMEKALKSNSEIRIVEKGSANWDREEATNLTNSWLATGEKIDGIAAGNDEMAIGAITALKQAGIEPSKICVGGIDATKDGLAQVASGNLYVTVEGDQVKEGKSALDVAIKLINGETVPPFLEVPFEAITKSSLGQAGQR